MKKFIPFFVTLASCAHVYCHGIWFEPRAQGTTLVLGDGPVQDKYEKEKIERLAVHAQDHQETPITPLHDGSVYAFVWPESGDYAVAQLNAGYWTERATGEWVNQAKDEVADAKQTSRYHLLAYHLRKWRSATPPKGLKLAIVPLVNPLTLKIDDDLPVQVLFDGNPVAGVNVIRDYVNDSENPVAKTDGDGKARIKIRNNGLNVIAVHHTIAATDKTKADTHSYQSTLSFVGNVKE